MPEAVFGIAKSEKLADRTIQKLFESGFEVRNISALFQDSKNKIQRTIYEEATEKEQKESPKKNLELQKHIEVRPDSKEGAVAGGVIGGTIGLLMGVAALAIPGVGPFIAAGPIVAALGSSAVGGSIGAFVGLFTGLGISQADAKRYEESLKEGGILICVHSLSKDEISKAKRIFTESKLTDITTTQEKETKEK